MTKRNGRPVRSIRSLFFTTHEIFERAALSQTHGLSLLFCCTQNGGSPFLGQNQKTAVYVLRSSARAKAGTNTGYDETAVAIERDGETDCMGRLVSFGGLEKEERKEGREEGLRSNENAKEDEEEKRQDEGR